MKFAQQLAARQQFASAVANLNLSHHHHHQQQQQQQQQQTLEANGNGLTATVALASSAQRPHVHGGPSDMSPLKTAAASQAVANQLNQHLLNLQQLQQQQQQQVLSDEDDELDEFVDEHPQQASSAAGHFYESLQALNQRQQHLGQGSAQTQPQPQHQASGSSTANSDNQQQSSAFLMDKNKKLFPQKLWELIHNPNIQHCLRWSQDGQRVYLNRTEFEQYYLKTPSNQFHTQKAISFVRQMNMYGFRKVDDCYYENDNFRRDRKQLLKNMIRRHPNKGLFVGLVDHHQLAAAAAAQQALQVNQQLQQLENQHKQRAEQALRLNNYLNQQHQQHQQQHPAFQTNFALAQAAAAASMNQPQCQNLHQNQMKPQQQQQQHEHSSPFEQMSASQLVAAQVAAASHYSHQSMGQSLAQQQQVGENLTISSNNNNNNNNQATKNTSISPAPATTAATQDNLKLQQQAKTSQQHQPKKSRLLRNFYASQQQQQQQVQETNQTNGSSKSPQLPSLREAKFGGLASVPTLNGQAAQAQVAAAAQARQAALHETLVRSLLQLKQGNHMNPHHHQDLVAALTQQHQQQQQPHQLHQAQQQQQRTLLESLASLSSAGTGSIVDPASNSPTERTATPPSGPPSPHHHHGYSSSSCDVGMALDLATSAAKSRSGRRHHDDQEGASSQEEEEEEEGDDDDDDDEYAIEVDDEEEHGNHAANMGRTSQVDSEMAASPLDGTKKVRKFLEDQMARVVSDELVEQMHDDDVESKLCHAIKREVDDDLDECREPRDQARKKAKLIVKENNHEHDDHEAAEKEQEQQQQQQDPSSISRRLVSEICSRRGDQLNEFALDEAAKYAQCFLGILIDDASLIASHANVEASEAAKDCDESRADKKASDEGDHEDKQAPLSCPSSSAASSSSASSSSSSAASSTQKPIDVSSLSLALKLIPAKLLAAIQQQVNGGRVGNSSSDRQVANLSTERATETPSVDRQATACERQQQQVAVDS